MNKTRFTAGDVYILIGHAHQFCVDSDMKLYFLELAEQIALQIEDRGLAKRCVELRGELSDE